MASSNYAGTSIGLMYPWKLRAALDIPGRLWEQLAYSIRKDAIRKHVYLSSINLV
jgi:hypothetical protein